MEFQTEEQIEFFFKAVAAQTKSASDISEILCEHSGRDKISSDDIITGLIYRLMTPMEDSDINKYMKQIDELFEKDTSSEEEEEEEIDDDEIITEPRVIQRNSCNCDLCIQARVCLENYKNYETIDPLGKIFHNSIKKTCQEYRLSI